MFSEFCYVWLDELGLITFLNIKKIKNIKTIKTYLECNKIKKLKLEREIENKIHRKYKKITKNCRRINIIETIT